MANFKFQVAGVRENVWSENAQTFETVEEATKGAQNLLSRWYGADLARVVPASTPNRETVDLSDPTIVVNNRR